MDSFDCIDACVVYTRSRNTSTKLLCINGGYFKSRKRSYQSAESLCRANDRFNNFKKSSTFRNDVTENNPLPLYDIALNFICEKSSDIESLCGFPELLGEEIFTQCLISGKFSNTSYAAAANLLKLFSTAYGNSLLSKLSLRDSLVAINEYEALLKPCLTHLTSLDLSENAIGGDHFILQEIGGLLKYVAVFDIYVKIKFM